MKKLLWLIPLILIFKIIGCGSGTGAVEGYVYIVDTTVPISGVTVTCGGVSMSTSSDGYYELNDVPTGQQTIKANKSDFEEYNKTINVSSGINIHDIAMTSSTSAPDLSGHVYNELDDNIQGAKVTIPPLGLSDWTDASGNYQIPNIPQGGYPIKVTHDDHMTFEDSVYLYSSDKKYDVMLFRNPQIIEVTDDSYIIDHYPDSCFGNSEYLYFGPPDGTGWRRETLLKFDLPTNIPCDSAFLEINNTYLNTDTTYYHVHIYILKEYWNEETVTWNNQPSILIGYLIVAPGWKKDSNRSQDIRALIHAARTHIPNSFYGFKIKLYSFGGKWGMGDSKENPNNIPPKLIIYGH